MDDAREIYAHVMNGNGIMNGNGMWPLLPFNKLPLWADGFEQEHKRRLKLHMEEMERQVFLPSNKQPENMDTESLIGYAMSGDEAARRILADQGLDLGKMIVTAQGKPLAPGKIMKIHQTLSELCVAHNMEMEVAREKLKIEIERSPAAVLKFDEPIKYIKTAAYPKPGKRGSKFTPPKKKRKK
jgi:hypothetical protein